MTINTQKLRQAAASVRAFLKPEYGREIAAAADIIEALEGQVAEYARMLEKQSAEAGARIDAQAAEIARLRDALETIAAYPHARDQEMSTAAMRKIARAALAQEQGGSDGV